jgi:hypothetical protein
MPDGAESLFGKWRVPLLLAILPLGQARVLAHGQRLSSR